MPSFANYPPPGRLLFGYDPEDLDCKHLARFIDRVVEEAVDAPTSSPGAGRPAYDPRLLVKILLMGYATGVRSSRQLERLCMENLGYLYLTRGITPSYHTLCVARTQMTKEVTECWVSLLALAAARGIKRVGRIDVDSTKIRANASSESVLRREEFQTAIELFDVILKQAEAQDAKEDSEGADMRTVESDDAKEHRPEQMREVVRSVRRAMRSPDGKEALDLDVRKLGPGMPKRIAAAISTLESTPPDQKHVSLSDPDAQMMAEGRTKKIQECHAFEAAVDNGLLVCARSSQSPTDSNRLEGLIEGAKAGDPGAVNLVVGDSGYFSGDGVAGIEESGITTCIPSPAAAREMRCGAAAPPCADAVMIYEADSDQYRCSQGRILKLTGDRKHGGSRVKVYRAVRDCSDCPVRAACIKHANAKRRTLKVAVQDAKIRQIADRFKDEQHRRIYHERGKNVETVFAYLRTTLNFRSWLLRGKDKVAAEAGLLSVALQIRKIQSVSLKSTHGAPA